MLKVLRDFKTALRSFTAGQNVAEDEIDGAPAARWIALGFLAANEKQAYWNPIRKRRIARNQPSRRRKAVF